MGRQERLDPCQICENPLTKKGGLCPPVLDRKAHKYGEALADFEEFERYEIGGKQLPAGLYSYYVGDTLVDMLRLMDSSGSRTVSYTAKFIHGKGDATLAALDAAVRGFRAKE